MKTNVTIFGLTGTGKTPLAKKLIESTDYDELIVITPQYTGEYNDNNSLVVYEGDDSIFDVIYRMHKLAVTGQLKRDTIIVLEEMSAFFHKNPGMVPLVDVVSKELNIMLINFEQVGRGGIKAASMEALSIKPLFTSDAYILDIGLDRSHQYAEYLSVRGNYLISPSREIRMERFFI